MESTPPSSVKKIKKSTVTDSDNPKDKKINTLKFKIKPKVVLSSNINRVDKSVELYKKFKIKKYCNFDSFRTFKIKDLNNFNIFNIKFKFFQFFDLVKIVPKEYNKDIKINTNRLKICDSLYYKNKKDYLKDNDEIIYIHSYKKIPMVLDYESDMDGESDMDSENDNGSLENVGNIGNDNGNIDDVDAEDDNRNGGNNNGNVENDNELEELTDLYDSSTNKDDAIKDEESNCRKEDDFLFNNDSLLDDESDQESIKDFNTDFNSKPFFSTKDINNEVKLKNDSKNTANVNYMNVNYNDYFNNSAFLKECTLIKTSKISKKLKIKIDKFIKERSIDDLKYLCKFFNVKEESLIEIYK